MCTGLTVSLWVTQKFDHRIKGNLCFTAQNASAVKTSLLWAVNQNVNKEQRLKLLCKHTHTHSMYNNTAAIRAYWPETGVLQLVVQHSEFLCRNRNLSHEATSSRNPWLYPERWSPGSRHVLVTGHTPAAAKRRAKRQGELIAPLFPVLKEVRAFSAV